MLPNFPRSKSAHFDFIDGIRALAALFVVVCHAYYEPSNGYYGDAAPWLYKLGLSNAGVALDTFIVVSGFCLMLPIARRGGDMGAFTEYLKRRCRRILPPYYAALSLAILFSLTVASQKTGRSGTPPFRDMAKIPLAVPLGSQHPYF